MKLTVHRLLVAAAAVTVVAFVIAGVLGNDREGFLGGLADVAWLGFLVGLLAVVVLSVTALTQSALRRRRGEVDAG